MQQRRKMTSHSSGEAAATQMAAASPAPAAVSVQQREAALAQREASLAEREAELARREAAIACREAAVVDPGHLNAIQTLLESSDFSTTEERASAIREVINQPVRGYGRLG